MTATEELRRLLDERGVEWEDFDGEPTWIGADGSMHYARYEFTFGGPTDYVTVYHLTPEQAIEATLGRGTCRDVSKTWGEFECSECGMLVDYGSDQHHANYCPNCGREVVGE